MRTGPFLLVALLLAGCAVPEDGLDADAQTVTRGAWFDSAMALSEEPENDTKAVRTGGFFRAWAAGTDYPTWLAPPATRDVLVDEVHVTLHLRVTGPVAETARFPDVMVYGGSGGAWMGYGNATTPSVLVPGQVYKLEVAVAVPVGGMWVPRGGSFGLKVVPVMMQESAADVEILVGGETSRAAWTERGTTGLDEELTPGSEKGETTGSAYAGPAAPASVSHAAKVTLDDEPKAIVAWLNTTAHQGIPDIDLAVHAPDGTTLAFSGTPTPKEFIRLHADNLRGPGEYRIVGTSYGSARSSFTLEWRAG